VYTDLRQFAEHRKTLYYFVRVSSNRALVRGGVRTAPVPGWPATRSRDGTPKYDDEFDSDIRAPLALAGLRGGKLAVLQLAQQRKDQYIPSESLMMTVVEDKSPLANRSRASVWESI
jgi:hypothetical protein